MRILRVGERFGRGERGLTIRAVETAGDETRYRTQGGEWVRHHEIEERVDSGAFWLVDAPEPEDGD